jgi:hypothetical protein
MTGNDLLKLHMAKIKLALETGLQFQHEVADLS